MSDFLSRMVRTSAERVERARALESEPALVRRALETPLPPPLRFDRFGVIAEVKRRSPAAGVLAKDDDVAARARGYVDAGAVAVSVLTEPDEFSGSLADLRAAASAVAAPVMRKDFLVDPYQVFEARASGAAGVLLILAILDDKRLEEMLDACARMSLFVLLEAFDEKDLARCAAPAGLQVLAGVNARDLVSLAVDPTRHERLCHALPPGIPAVAESGIETPEDARRVASLGYSLALVGSALMRAADPAALVVAMADLSFGCCPRNYGVFGGRFVPETLVGALERLEAGARAALRDPGFTAKLDGELRDWVGRPTPLTEARRLGASWNASVWLKREDLAHTGAHKINNALGQALLAERMGARRVIAETGAGQHGVATAAACARLGLPCTVYMGVVDVERQAPNVERMLRFGAEVVRVTTGDRTLRAAIDEALRDWVSDPEGTYYLLGSAVGPHPYPWLVRELQSVIGREARRQAREQIGRLPDVAVACVGGGSNSIGLFHPFLDDREVELLGIEAGGIGVGLGQHAATLARGRPGVLHGSYSMLLQDGDGQIQETHSISAGLDYPGVGPEHAFLQSIGRVRYDTVSDEEALDATLECCAREGILPALESAHALAGAKRWAAGHPGRAILIGLSGRGDKDLATLAHERRIP